MDAERKESKSVVEQIQKKKTDRKSNQKLFHKNPPLHLN